MRNIPKPLKIALLTATFSLFLLNCSAQVVQELQNSFNLYKQSSLQEKIYVHTDKTVYLPGEILWFKVYCVDGNDHKPLNMSKVVYVEILDNSQSPVAQAKVLMKNGSGDGSLYIPVTVNNGNYRFRAYTNWMKNFSPDFYFEKQITLVNPLRSPEPLVTDAGAAYDVRFFPEGGNLVSGLKSTVAVKVVGKNGRGAAFTGVIVDQHNDTTARFASLKFGMGSFVFSPAAGNTYKAIVKIGSEPPLTKDIPQVASQGYVMAVTDAGNGKLTVTINGTDNQDEATYLFVHTRQTVITALSTTMNNGAARFSIDKGSLGSGISHITIFNNAKQPVCERLYFKRPTQQMLIDAAADQQQYGLRKKVSVNVLAKDASGKSLNADLSMAVYRVDSLQTAGKDNIFSYLWLGSDLKGNIESADYYFKNTDAEADAAADNLMLTQGWSRFQWAPVLENKTPAFSFLPEYGGHIITAKVVNTQTNAPAGNIITYLGIPGKRVQLYTAQSDSAGRLLYNMKDFFGPSEIIAQTNQLKDSTYRIDIASPYSEQYTKTSLSQFEFNPAMAKALQDHSLGVQVENIYSGDMIKHYDDPMVDSSAFYGTPFKTYKLDDYTRFTTMEEDLREYVSEDNIVNTRGNFHIKVLSDRGFLDSDPLALVDGIPVFNINKVFTIDPLKVRKLEVVPYRYYYGPAEAEGVFSFITYKGDLGGVELDPRAIVMDYEGLQLHREFYSPVYDTPAQAASRIPDFRNMLYWSPSVVKGGKGAVSFYTSELPGKYVGVVEGITPAGDAGVQYFTFDVK